MLAIDLTQRATLPAKALAATSRPSASSGAHFIGGDFQNLRLIEFMDGVSPVDAARRTIGNPFGPLPERRRDRRSND